MVQVVQYSIHDVAINPGEDLLFYKVMLLVAIQLCKFSKILNASKPTGVFCCCLLKLQTTRIFTALCTFTTLSNKKVKEVYASCISEQ